MWIEPMDVMSFDEKRLVVSSPNFFSRKRVVENYAGFIEKEAERILGEKCFLSIEIANGHSRKRCEPAGGLQLVLPQMSIRPHSGRLLRKDFTFDQFVVGGNNDFAYSASLSLASKRQNGQNTLYLLSATGMGKSHLSQAIGHHILSEFPKEKVYYITAEDFTNEMITAFRHDSFNTFKEKYRNGCDVLLLEDVHHISGKERTQIELSHTLDSLLEADKKIIFSSCYLPTEIPKLDDKIRSRLGCSLISTIDAPDFQMRVRILNRKAAMRGATLPKDVVHFLASELTDDVRQLESGLIGVIAKSSLLGLPIDLNLATSVVNNIVRSRAKITIESIKKMVSREYRVSTKDMESKSRRQCHVKPRQIAIYLARRYTDSPLQTIGKSFNRYHATALHSINTIEAEMRHDDAFRRQVDLLCKKLEMGKI
jgi:chromosomal replication initiator protein